MNTTHLTTALRLIALTAGLSVGPACLHAEEPSGPAPARASVFILDDLSGEELLKKHGIRTTTQEDLLGLLDGVWQAGCRVEVRHLVIDEDATGKIPGLLKLEPFTAQRPEAPVTTGSMREIEDSRQEYFKRRTLYLREAGKQLDVMKNAVTAFMETVGQAQVQTAQKFDAKLEQRKGRDYSRSDVAGAVLSAGRLLGGAGPRFLILNTDCVDQPGNHKPRRVPFTAQELDPGVTLIFVNQSRVPDASPLFVGLKNPVEHADTMKEAMDRIVSLLGNAASRKPAADATAAR